MIKELSLRDSYNYQTETHYAAIRADFGNNHWVDLSPNTGDVISVGQDWITAPTDEEIKEATMAAKAAIAAGYRQERFYVRFGDLPKCGYSKNYANGKPEAGVSVIEARQNLLTAEIELMPYGSCHSWLWIQDRPLYEVTGDLVGYGSDGEPLLKNCKVVTRIR